MPVFYQKRWCNDVGKLVVYSQPRLGKIVTSDVGPEATGWEKDLYAFLGANPELQQFLETKLLRRADELAALAVAKMIKEGPGSLTFDERSAWSRFVINSMIRHPEAFAEVRAGIERRWMDPDAETQAEYEKLRSPTMPPLFLDWVIAQGDNLAARIRIRLIQGILDNELNGRRLNAMRWRLLDVSKSDFKLLTSDSPVLKEVNEPKILFVMPVSPTVAFAATTHQDVMENVQNTSPNQFVKTVNLHVVGRARKYVYARDRNQHPFIMNHIMQHQEMGPFFPSLARGPHHA